MNMKKVLLSFAVIGLSTSAYSSAFDSSSKAFGEVDKEEERFVLVEENYFSSSNEERRKSRETVEFLDNYVEELKGQKDNLEAKIELRDSSIRALVDRGLDEVFRNSRLEKENQTLRCQLNEQETSIGRLINNSLQNVAIAEEKERKNQKLICKNNRLLMKIAELKQEKRNSNFEFYF